MASADDLRRLALALPGTTEAPHFERAGFKADRIYATLAPDGLSVNVRLEPVEQDFRCEARPDAYRAIPNAWGAQGWTTVTLSALEAAELETVLRGAWQNYGVKPPKAGKPRKR